MYFRETMKSLLPYLSRYRFEMILGIGAMVITDICVLLAPKLQAYAIRSIEQRAELSLIFSYSFGVFGLIALAGLFRYFWRVLYMNSSMKIAFEMRNELFRKLMSFSHHFYASYTTGDLMARATNDLQAVRMMIGPGFIIGVDILVLSFSAAVLMFLMDWRLALYALLPTPFIALAVGYFNRLIHTVFEKVQEQFSRLSEKVRENISGIRVIKTYTQEGQEVNNFRKLSNDYVRENMRLWKVEGLFRPIIIFFSTVSTILIMVFGLQRVIDGRLDLGDFWAFNEYLWIIIWPMIGIGWFTSLVLRGTASMKRLNEIIERESQIKEALHPVELKSIQGRIEFVNVSFRFDDEAEWVLRDINLCIQAGEKIAVVGRVGAGKTALVSLLQRFTDPQVGQIKLDGIDIRNLSLRKLRQAFGFVPQETFLFSDTIKENIVFGMNEYTASMISDVTHLAQLEQNIQEFPRKLNTLVGEKGITLSGGQKQRTAIARAIIVNPRIIIFDDSFSSLDTETEQLILLNLKEAWKDKTTIAISHRVSTIQNFERIIVLEEGRIIESGTHEQLLDRQGSYWRLYQRQQAGILGE